MKNYIWYFILLSVSSLSFGQDSTRLEFPDQRIGITPSAILNDHVGLQFSYDRKLYPRWNATAELAFIFDSPAIAKGVRIRPGIEYILLHGKYVSLNVGLHYSYRRTVEYTHVVEREFASPFERIYYNVRRDRIMRGFIVKPSFMIKITPRWYLELGNGFGPGKYTFKNYPALTENQFVPDQPFGRSQGDNNWVLFFYYVNISYDISTTEKKKNKKKTRKRKKRKR